MIFKNIKVKLYPTVKQKQMLDDHFNAYRFCYNLCLEYKSLMWNYYKINKSSYDLQFELFKIMKTTDWLKNCKVESIRQAAHDVCSSYEKFFRGNGFPKYKNKRMTNSFSAHQSIHSIDGKIKFFGFYIKYRDSDSHIHLLNNKKINKITFKKDSVGNYFAICLIELPDLDKLLLVNKTIGIDLGLNDLLITSDGTKYANNRYLQSTAFKIANLQRRFSRTQKGSSNRNKLRIKIAKLHRRAIRQREHYYHQITNELIRDNQTIVLETLKINNMVHNHKLARSIQDANWGLIIKMVGYKANWNGRTIIRLDTFYPSTKTCSNCGSIKDMPLSERVYNCECGLCLDRDINAAINIRNAGLKIPGVPVEVVGYEPVEAGSNSLILTI